MNRAYCRAVKSRSAVLTSIGVNSQSCPSTVTTLLSDTKVGARLLVLSTRLDSTRGLNASDTLKYKISYNYYSTKVEKSSCWNLPAL